MLQNDFDYMVKEFGVPVKLNDETATRKAIISNENISDTLPNFDDKKIHCSFEIKRGDVITYDNIIYLVISDVQSKQLFKYKAIMRPMINSLQFTYETGGYYEEVDRFGEPIWIIKPETVTVDLPCIAYQEGNPTISNGQIRMPENRIKVIMPDNYESQQIEMASEHQMYNNYYAIVDINLLQKGLRIFTMERTSNPA